MKLITGFFEYLSGSSPRGDLDLMTQQNLKYFQLYYITVIIDNNLRFTKPAAATFVFCQTAVGKVPAESFQLFQVSNIPYSSSSLPYCTAMFFKVSSSIFFLGGHNNTCSRVHELLNRTAGQHGYRFVAISFHATSAGGSGGG